MDKVSVNGVELAYEVTGDGEPILLIHGAFVCDAMKPLADRFDGYRVIRYHRRGYGESGAGVSPDLATHAADARALLEALDAAPAHVIGHSYGGSTALQLAIDAPDTLKSMTLLEAATPGQTPSAETTGAVIGQVIAPFFEGRGEEAVDRFLHMVFGPAWREDVAQALSPASVDQAISDADDAFAGDLGSLMSWTITGEQAASIDCPVLIVLGAKSDETVRAALAAMEIDAPQNDVFGEMTEVQSAWMPHARVLTLPGINHALQVQDAETVAGVIGTFLAEQRAVLT